MTFPAGGHLSPEVLGLIIRLREYLGLQADGLKGSLDYSAEGKGDMREVDYPIFDALHEIRIRIPRVHSPLLPLDYQIERTWLGFWLSGRYAQSVQKCFDACNHACVTCVLIHFKSQVRLARCFGLHVLHEKGIRTAPKIRQQYREETLVSTNYLEGFH